MPTPIFICGAECGLDTVGTLSAGVEHWSAKAGAVSVATSGPASMRSTRAFRHTQGGGGGQSRLTHTFGSAIASPATVVARVYVYFTSFPGSNFVDIFTATSGGGNTVRARVDSSGNIYAYVNSGGSSITTLSTGQWYLIDIRGVFNSTTTCDVRVNGSSTGQASASLSASTCVSVAIGSDDPASAYDFYTDDFCVSGTSGDYPIGAGTVYGLYPDADAQHNYSSTTDFLDGGTAQASLAADTSEVDTWLSLRSKADGGLSTTVDNSNFVTNATGGTAEWLAWRFENLPADAATINGVMVVSAHHSATASTNAQCLLICDHSQMSPTMSMTNVFDCREITHMGTISGGLWASGLDLSETTICTHVTTAATGTENGAWTVANVNDLAAVWGSNDVTPDAYIDGICLEVDYVASSYDGRIIIPVVEPNLAATLAGRI